MSSIGFPQSPKPPTARVAPSGMSATASAALEKTLPMTPPTLPRRAGHPARTGISTLRAGRHYARARLRDRHRGGLAHLLEVVRGAQWDLAEEGGEHQGERAAQQGDEEHVVDGARVREPELLVGDVCRGSAVGG